MSLVASATTNAAWPVARSIGVIAVLDYLTPTINGVLAGVLPSYASVLTRAIEVYLQFCAYAQGWISVPTSLMLSA